MIYPTGLAPAVALINPKLAVNVGNVQRACSCFGVKQLWWTGNRVSLKPKGKERLPREERMKGYKDVDLLPCNRFLDHFPDGVVPVAVELKEGAEKLFDFVHPQNPLYIFGPEDGSVTSPYLNHCHRFVQIPTRHCLNLAAAVSVVLYSWRYQRWRDGLDDNLAPADYLAEHRGFIDLSDQFVGD